MFDTTIRISGAKQQTVLAMLLLAEDKPVPLSRLIDAVWGDSVPPTAAKQVRNAVSNLRQVLARSGVTIRPAGDGYRLDRAGSGFDLEDFTRRVELGGAEMDPARTAGSLRAALSLWRGPALAGLTSPVLRSQVASIEELRLTVLEQCINLELDQGQHASLVGELTAAVAENPFRERFVAQLMIALCRSGARAQALKVFDATRRLLRDELGVDPEPELRELNLRILASELPSAPGLPDLSLPWHNLPGDTVPLTGRSTEEDLVVRALLRHAGAGKSTPPPAVVAVDGMAGVGKTAFALHLGRRLAASYPDGQLYVGLQAHAAGRRRLPALQALAVLLRAVGVPAEAIPDDLQGCRAAWHNRLVGKRVLVVLDDAADTAHITPLLTGVPGCLTVVTSRSRLSSLHSTSQLSLAEFTIAAGRDLFGSVVGDDRPITETAAVDEILRHCGRLPLAIRTAAIRLRHRTAWSVSYLASRLADDRSRLAELSMESCRLTDAFDMSFYQLDSEHQRLFRILGGLDSTEIEPDDVAARAGLSVSRAARLLESLVDSHLLDATGHGLYRMNELVRAYSMQLA
ncbi:AfsR/SARP family transcriptional regulator [Actinoplanes sp. TBRC 11911]|uniref:AfsR/SARP family transcriptional regulator n=1 Tax=Actinoplanes sp. TBRC 11911 TaxID=2729386 RepID=UPI00145F8D18|nr:AfsR/SARP family transcriptional regulator [Actinoplanes sp. TBRC 11911]NMO50547.1 AfsR/SARP family transcriptional regulator [Actinoplanes sp. TBRC 11911]